MKYVLPFVVGALMGLGMAVLAIDFDNVWFLLIALYISFFLHVIIHELGHLVGGKLSGYEFKSFRIGNYMLIKANDKWSFAKYKIPGTAGQCLMYWPKDRNEPMRYRLYLSAGYLSNLVVSILALGIVIGSSNVFLIYSGKIFVAVGICIILTNAIPLLMGGVPNDGYTLKALKNNPEAQRAIVVQLDLNARLLNGEKIKDMPSTYFEIKEGTNLNHPITGVLGVYRCSYLQCLGKFEEAKAYTKYILEHAPKIPGLYKNELKCELLYSEWLEGTKEDEIEALYDKELKNYIQATSSFVSKKRLMYTYYLLKEGDEQKAEKEKNKFNKLAKHYPYKGDLENEKMWMAYALEKYTDEKSNLDSDLKINSIKDINL